MGTEAEVIWYCTGTYIPRGNGIGFAIVFTKSLLSIGYDHEKDLAPSPAGVTSKTHFRDRVACRKRIEDLDNKRQYVSHNVLFCSMFCVTTFFCSTMFGLMFWFVPPLLSLDVSFRPMFC